MNIGQKKKNEKEKREKNNKKTIKKNLKQPRQFYIFN